MLKLRFVLLNSKAAIDLASIMVGIIVIGLIGGVIAATVFAVIPWAQDSAAKQQLESIHTAQNAAYGLSADPSRTLPQGQERNSFTNSEGLEQQGLLTQGDSYCTTAVGKNDYRAYSKSSAGKIWFASNGNKQAQVLTNGVPGLNDCAVWVEENTGSETANPTTPTTPTQPGTGEENENPGTDPGTPEEDTRVIYGDTTYSLKCDKARNVTLNLSGVTGTITWRADGAIVATQNLTNRAPQPVALAANKTYSATLEGTFTSFTPYSFGTMTEAQCYRTMDSWASDSGVQNATGAFSYMTNLLEVPDSIPATVDNLKSAFLTNSLSGLPMRINDSSISNWDVSEVTDMSSLFTGADQFNQPLNNWDVSKVTNMSNMFGGAAAFNQDLNDWDVSKVTNMSSMFSKTADSTYPKNPTFNGNISEWDTSSVTNMSAMFYLNRNFNQNIGNWDTSKTTNMTMMFSGATTFNQNLNNWDVNKVTQRSDFADKSGLLKSNYPNKWK